jgi:hypothetical protein
MGSEHATLEALTDIITEVEHLISTVPAARRPHAAVLETVEGRSCSR